MANGQNKTAELACCLGQTVAAGAVPRGVTPVLWHRAKGRAVTATLLLAQARLGVLHRTAGQADLAWLRAQGLGQVAAAALQCAALVAAAAKRDRKAGATVGRNLCKHYPQHRETLAAAWAAAWRA